jgi:hypothetical protein
MKKIITEQISRFYADWSEIEVSELEKVIKNIKKLGATHIMYDEDESEVTLLKKRLETDAEYKVRTEDEENRKQRMLNKEREEYLRLKEKFENEK